MATNDSNPNVIDGWTWTVAPAIASGDGTIWTKIVAYDGEFAVSYIYEHASIEAKATLLYEVEGWLADLWLGPGGNLYAVDEDGQLHVHAGGSWRVLRGVAASIVSSLWGVDNDNLFATTEGAVLRWTGTGWTELISGLPGYLEQVRGRALNDLYAVGSRGLIVHFDGNRWMHLLVPTNVDLNAVCVDANGVAYAAGTEGVVLIGSGDQWSVLQFDEYEFVDAVIYKNTVYLAATDSGVFRLKDDSIECVRDDIHAVRLTSNDEYLCVAGGLSFHQFDGHEWKSYTYTYSPNP